MNPMDEFGRLVLSGYRTLGGGSHGTLQLSSRPDAGRGYTREKVRLDRLHAHEQRASATPRFVRPCMMSSAICRSGSGELPGRGGSADLGALGIVSAPPLGKLSELLEDVEGAAQARARSALLLGSPLHLSPHHGSTSDPARTVARRRVTGGDLAGARVQLEEALPLHDDAQPFELGRTLMVRGQVERRAKQKRAARRA